MSAQIDAQADWTADKERASLRMLRLMRWVALTAGRRLTRALLPAIALYFVATSAKARRESARYLARALGRPPRLLDVLRHFHCFAATILDRVYLLQAQYDRFELRADGIDAMDRPLARGDGVLMFGAHLGSFEALRALGRGGGFPVAMIMYEDNARALNATLAALAPNATLRTIALGRLDSMLTLRRWLDDAGVAGLLCDRTLPVSSQRSRNHRLPFLGAPASFSDGPFRLAAMLRREVVFMAGLYHGGHRYELRFMPLADFTEATSANRDALIRAALERYVAVLESLCREVPYNWFNFFDFWAGDAEAAAAGLSPADAASEPVLTPDAADVRPTPSRAH